MTLLENLIAWCRPITQLITFIKLKNALSSYNFTVVVFSTGMSITFFFLFTFRTASIFILESQCGNQHFVPVSALIRKLCVFAKYLTVYVMSCDVRIYLYKKVPHKVKNSLKEDARDSTIDLEQYVHAFSILYL